MQHIFQENKPILINNSLFRSIPESDIPILLKHLEAYTGQYKKDTYIKMTGDPADFIGIVLSGEIYICQTDFYGNRSIVASFTAGNLFAEAFACADVETLPVSVIALQNSTVLLLDCKRVLTGCSNACPFHSRLVHNLLRGIAQKNLMLTSKIRCMSQKTTQEKLMEFLLEQAKQQAKAEFVIPYDRQALADYLGVERSAMSAEISKLKKAGRIDCSGSRFRVLTPDKKSS